MSAHFLMNWTIHYISFTMTLVVEYLFVMECLIDFKQNYSDTTTERHIDSWLDISICRDVFCLTKEKIRKPKYYTIAFRSVLLRR